MEESMKYKIWCDGCSGTGYRKSCVCEGKGYTNGEVACEADMLITIPDILEQYLPKVSE